MSVKKLITLFLPSLLIACEVDPLVQHQGKVHDVQAMQEVRPAFCHSGTLEPDVSLGLYPDEMRNTWFYASSGVESPVPVTVSLTASPELVQAYNEAHGTEYQVLPEEYYSFPDGTDLIVPTGGKASTEKRLRILGGLPSGEVLAKGDYLLPVTVTLTEERQEVHYFFVEILKRFESQLPLYTGEDCFTVFYLNTSNFDPRLATEFFVTKRTLQGKILWQGALGNIVNLRVTRLEYDEASDRVIYNVGSDIRYLFDHYDTYIQPVRECGRKICLSIECGSGYGFCNLSDAQIEDFTGQVAAVVASYRLDGINLWDRNVSYGQAGFPEMNTTSYPKLIKALREALGADKLLTLTDYEAPTEYFWDTEATGGIAVGEYLDYAWSGYCSETELVQIVDPWNQGEETVSTLHPRKPIAGLSPARYGVVNYPWSRSAKYSGVTDDEYVWALYGKPASYVSKGLKHNNILVFEDLRSTSQDTWEFTPHKYPNQVIAEDSFFDDYSYLFLETVRPHRSFNNLNKDLEAGTSYNKTGGYYKWIKDW